MGRQIEVTPEQLDAAAGKIDNLSADYEKQYTALYSATDAMASTWNGKDNQAFISQINGFQDDFKKMKTLMDQYSDFLKKTAKAYRDTQDAVVADAKKLTN